jgi:hypothetical protein
MIQALCLESPGNARSGGRGGGTFIIAPAPRPSDQDQALKIRATWMRDLGLPAEEIAEFCNPDLYPANLEEECENLRAAQRNAGRGLTNTDLDELARKYPPPTEWPD